jgi:hypothetical protein
MERKYVISLFCVDLILTFTFSKKLLAYNKIKINKYHGVALYYVSLFTSISAFWFSHIFMHMIIG